MTSVLFRVDAGGRVGMGHAHRTRAIIEWLRDWGVHCSVATRTLAAMAMPWDCQPHLISDDDQLHALAVHFDVLVVDLPELPAGMASVRATQVIIPRSHPWPGLPPPPGPLYAPIRRMFARPIPRERDGTVQRVYVSAGGSDAHGLADILVTALHHLRRDATGVESPLVAAGQFRDTDVVDAMDACDLALVAHGMTTYECLSRGLPTVVVSPTPYHAEGAAGLERLGAVASLGVERNPDVIACHLDALLRDPSELRSLSRCGAALVDGLGAMRVARRIYEAATGAESRQDAPGRAPPRGYPVGAGADDLVCSVQR